MGKNNTKNLKFNITGNSYADAKPSPPPDKCIMCGLPFDVDFEVNLKILCPLHLGSENNKTLGDFWRVRKLLDVVSDEDFDFHHRALQAIIARLEMIEELIKKDSLNRGIRIKSHLN